MMSKPADSAPRLNLIISTNPATGTVLGQVPVTVPEDLDGIISRAHSAQTYWGKLSPKQRGKSLTDIRRAIIAHMEPLSKLIADETGKTEWEGFIEIFTVVEHLRTLVHHGPAALRRQKRSSGILKHKRGWVRFLPHGTVGVISPWNYPLILTAAPIFEALMAGNAVVAKPSEITPLTGQKLFEIIAETAVPEDLVQMVYGYGDLGAALVEHKKIDIICFTGSVPVGRKIAARCGQLLKPAILELGGKDPMLVLEDANIRRAAQAAVWGSFTNAGQTCISVERVYVLDAVADEFIDYAKRITVSLRTGSDKESVDVGAIVHNKQKELIQRQINRGLTSGGIEIAAGHPLADADSEGNFLVPRVIEFEYRQPAADVELLSTETFGPVLAVVRVPDEETAVRLANDTGYGLSASVFTKNKPRGRRIARQLRAGSVIINDALSNYICADLPFGGIGISGIGRVHGKEGLRSFSQIQSVVEDRFGLPRELWWYPVSRRVQSIFRWFARFWYG